MDGPRPEAAQLSAVEPNTDSTPKEVCVTGPPYMCPAVGSRPRAPEPAESGWTPVKEFTVADIFQHSRFGDMLNSLKSLPLSGDSWPNYVRLKGEVITHKYRGSQQLSRVEYSTQIY